MSSERVRIFEWNHVIETIQNGRQYLGPDMPVVLYRMFEYSMKQILYDEFGKEKTDELFRKAGYLAGTEFAVNMLPLQADHDTFLNVLSEKLEAMKLGLLRIEKADFENRQFIITVYEDLDCSGLPFRNEVVCNYDEGLLSGILEAYLKEKITVREVDCWASGERICRFKGYVTDGEKSDSTID